MLIYRCFLAVVVLVFLVTGVSLAQDETAIARLHTQLAEFHTGNTEENLQTATKKFERASEVGNEKERIHAARDLGIIYLNSVHDYDKALDLFMDAVALCDSLELEDEKLLTYLCVAKVFYVVGDYLKCAQFLEQALELNRDNRHINADAFVLNRLGRVAAALDQLDLALEYYVRVLRYADDIDRRFEAEAHFNLGKLYTLKAQYTEALQYHRKALQLRRQLRDRTAEARSLNDIGILYELMKNDERCEANHEVALEIRQELKDKRGIAESYNHLAALELRKGDAPRSIELGSLALENAREADAREQLLRSYELLSEAYKKTGDFRRALENRELGLAIQELINGEKHERQLLERENQYVVQLKETEIHKLEALRAEREREIATQKKFRNFLVLVVMLAVISAGLLLILYLVKQRSNQRLRIARSEVQRQNEQLQQLNSTKDKFFSIISHDLKGPLNSLTSFSRLLIDHTGSLTKEEIKMLATDLDKSVRNLLALLENLLEWSRSQTGNIDFAAETFSLTEVLEANRVLLGAQAGAKNISINLGVEGDYIVNLHKNSINTVVRNLVSNAIKFTPAGGSIDVGIAINDSTLKIYVSDTGVGMPPEVIQKLFRVGSKHSTTGTASEKGTGLGLILCREFVEKNNGQISVESSPGKGSVFTCTFPRSVVQSVREESVSFHR